MKEKIGLWILLILAYNIFPPALFGQAVSLSPNRVEKDRPTDVTLSINPVPQDPTKQLTSATAVKVGNREVSPKSVAAGQVTFAPPRVDSSGEQEVVVLSGATELARAKLTYVDDQSRLGWNEEARKNLLVGSYWFYGLVSLMFLFLITMFVLAIWQAVFPGRSGLSAASAHLPLGLPAGSFRSILAYSLIVYLGFYVLTSVLSASAFNPPEYLLGVVATVIGFYFGSRSTEESGGVGEPRKVGSVRGRVQKPGGTEGVSGVTIRLKRAADDIVLYSRVTALNGSFDFPSVAPGKYNAQVVTKPETAPPDQELMVVEGSDQELVFITGAEKPS